MQWDDVGYLVGKNRYNENSLISEFYTKDHGKCSGIIFGATSKKIKNYLQVGNKLYLNYNYKTEGKLGYFKVEIFKVHSPYYFNRTYDFEKVRYRYYNIQNDNILTKILLYSLNIKN